MRQSQAAALALLLFLMAFLPDTLLWKTYGAVPFGNGEITFPEELVAEWDRMGEALGMERTGFIGHVTPTYPNRQIGVYKQQTSVSPTDKWKKYEYRNMYCVSHSREYYDDPTAAFEISGVWYAVKQPYTLQNRPENIDKNAEDPYIRRLNFLIMAYAANHEAYQNGVNSNPVTGTANQYICQVLCGCAELGLFTGDYAHDWSVYAPRVEESANRYNPSSLGSSQVYRDMMASMEKTFQRIWNTAKLLAVCTESSDTGYSFHPVIEQGADGMYHAAYQLTAETQPFFAAASITPYGDWNYTITADRIDFTSPTGQMPGNGAIGEINLGNVNGIVTKTIGNESVVELHSPTKVAGRWSLTFAQGNLVANLEDGLKIKIGEPGTGGGPQPSPPSSGQEVMRYKHTERWQADYVVNLRKLDAETGEPLEGAVFDILEAFDDSQLEGSILEDDNWDNDAKSQFLRWDGWDSPYGKDAGNDPCEKDQEITDKDGWLCEMTSFGTGSLIPGGERAHRDTHYYSYTKGYCGGHPEPESDGEDEEEDEAAWEEYYRQIEICENLAASGGFYHSLDGAQAQMIADRDRHYRAFVSLTYDYSARELKAREGYIVHNQDTVHEPFEDHRFDGVHADTLPIETVTVHSSQYYALSGSNKLPLRERNTGEAGTSSGTELFTASPAKVIDSRMPDERVLSGQVLNTATASDSDMRPVKDGGALHVLWETLCDLASIPLREAKKWSESWDAGDNPMHTSAASVLPVHTSSAAKLERSTPSDGDDWILDEDEWYQEATGSDWGEELPRQYPAAIERISAPMMSRANDASDFYRQGRDASVRNTVSWLPSPAAVVAKADPDYTSQGGTDWIFEVYDHRTEGEVHINKRDLELQRGESGDYDSYGDTQGDGTLEGAVYGLFAAEDIVHPDGKTGAVFQKDNLVASATTDKNGDASFMAITEAPGTVYAYAQGKTVSTGFSGPDNYYKKAFDKESSNPNGWSYPIQDNEASNGNCWIGRPLLLGSYYVRELTRSEGYELSVYGIEAEISNRVAWELGGDTGARGTVAVESIAGVTRMMEDTKRTEAVTEITFVSKDTVSGYDAVISGVLPNRQPSFSITRKGRTLEWRTWKETEISYEPVNAAPGTQVIIDGNSVEAMEGDTIALPNGTTAVVQKAQLVPTTPEKKTYTGINGVIPTFDARRAPELNSLMAEDPNPDVFIHNINDALSDVGYYEAGTDMPYVLIELGNVRSLWAGKLYDYFYSASRPAFNAARLERLIESEGNYYAVLRYSFTTKDGNAYPVVYSTIDDSLYVQYEISYSDGSAGYLYRAYPVADLTEGTDYEMGNSMYRFVRLPNVRPENSMVTLYENLDSLSFVDNRQYKSVWVYADGEFLRAADGSYYQKEIVQEVERSGFEMVETVTDTAIEATYQETANTWTIHVSPELIPADGRLALTIRYGEREIGSGSGVSAAAMPSMNLTGSYIKPVVLSYPGQNWTYGDGGTRIRPVGVQERSIKQKIKVVKNTEAGVLNNFRFKTYLKSNLKRLYRSEDGTVVWQDRKGNERVENDAGVMADRAAFPELVRKIYTRVSHRISPLFQDAQDAVVANTELYSYTDGLINKEQNNGYTAVLEMVEQVVSDESGTRRVQVSNYEKFFDAVWVANHDKWDDGVPTYTSWRPIGNLANRSEATAENARVSDAVRQFAIDWYLDDEIAKLTRPVEGGQEEREDKDGVQGFSVELYDEGLRQALIKAENYLKPFFTYDLDEIYAIWWDSEEGGGSDGDFTTLSADTLHGTERYCYALSSYLPYGTYVVVEQKPQYAGDEYGRQNLNDFMNKHYETDAPKEVELPAVYEEYAGTQGSREVMNRYYLYDKNLAQAVMERNYKIRFGEENHVIYAHSDKGDFQVYKYGLDIGQIKNGAKTAGKGDYFALTQSEYRPYQNHYNDHDDRTVGDVPYYLTEGQSGRMGISKNYRYSSVSEHGGTAEYAGIEEDAGELGSVPKMHGVQTAFQGRYAPMLVPWSVAALADESSEKETVKDAASGESSYTGYAYTKLYDRLYKTKLRLEKLDSETHENILHDGAIFAVFKAKRDERKDGAGRVLFYEEDTTISGTKEFLEAMGAVDIRPMSRGRSVWRRIAGWLAKKEYGPGNLYTGVVPAGTPVCREEDRVIMSGSRNGQEAVFQSYTTVTDMQTVGYLETPQPLDAGVYVIVEEKAPAGYVRSRPVAVEIYSDKVSYYKEGGKDSRVVAALYEPPRLAQIYLENSPVKLIVEKLKESSADTANTTKDKMVTYKISGRIDGTLTAIGGNPDYVYAYENGTYLGYAWKKGTLEMLAKRKEAAEATKAAGGQASEQVELVYQGNIFAGYGYVTRRLDTANDDNQYVVGAMMTLFDAIALNPSGDVEDHAYEGLVIERSLTGNVTRMYVKEGYAGEKTEFVKEQKDGKNIWSAVVLQRHDTDILYYDLDSLDILVKEQADGKTVVYGYDRNHTKIPVERLEDDKEHFTKTDTEHSIFAFKGGVPYLELTGGDFTKIEYSPQDKVLTVDKDTVVYHIDRDGNRDAQVDPHTGMAYVPAKEAGNRILVWSVNIRRDRYGNVIARDKITTSRVATIGENQKGYDENVTLEVINHSGKPVLDGEKPSYQHKESGSITGTWKSDGSGKSHQETTVNTNKSGKNRNEEVLVDDNNGTFAKELNPTVDEHGLPRYYQRSDDTYEKGTRLYDRNDSFVRYQDSDNLEEYNNNAYRIIDHDDLYDGDETKEIQQQKALYHRLGEGYILENTWITSDSTPNDPFSGQVTKGQPDILKRVPAGNYIMEELKAPAGYLKGFPVAVTVEETSQMQYAKMVDKTTKVEITKLDGVNGSGNSGMGGKGNQAMGAYSYACVPGATLALYPAKRVYTTDILSHPKGYYLKKTETEPVTYFSTESTTGETKKVTAKWITGPEPIYIEGIPAGSYLLEELSTPKGYVSSSPVEVEIDVVPEVQVFQMYDDHTKIEVEKYCMEEGTERLLGGAEFAIFETVTDDYGNVVYEEEQPVYDPSGEIDRWVTRDMGVYRDFVTAFEEMYRIYGTQPGTGITWESGGNVYSAEYKSSEQLDAKIAGGEDTSFPTRATLVFQMEDGSETRISVYGESANRGGREFIYEYQFDYRRLPQINQRAVSYITLEGRRRIDYLPAGRSYVLKETRVPEGYAQATPVVITVPDSSEVNLYRIENQEGMLLVSKTLLSGDGELVGAHLGLYRADDAGNLVQDETHLVADWITGGDGIYTELDGINRRIPNGYQPGDLKPHAVRKLESGIYWLVELESPEYLCRFEPIRVEYHQGEKIRVIRGENRLAEGELTVHKADRDGRPLSGAVYELSACRQSDLRTPVFKKTLSGEGDTICISGLSVGEVGEDNKIIPYRYQLKEVLAPDGYACSTEIFTWQFAPDRQGVSYSFGEPARQEITVTNQKTRIVIGKKDFDDFGDRNTVGAFLPGAQLAVYEVTGRDETGELVCKKDPFDQWMTADGPHDGEHVIEGLVAGRSYLLKEIKAPEGYYLMQPVLLTVSSDGRRLCAVSNRQNTVTVHTVRPSQEDMGEELLVSGSDAIDSVTIHGRYVTGVEYCLSDISGKKLARWNGGPEDHVLVRGDTLLDGKAYTLTETTRYSDGSETVTGKITKPLYFDENGQCRMKGRMAENVTLSMQYADGVEIDSFQPGELIQEKTIKNNVLPENPKITMKNRGGQPGDVLHPRQAILNTVTFVNPLHQDADMELVITADDSTEIIDGGIGKLENGRLIFSLPKQKALTEGAVTFITSVDEHSWASSVTASIRCHGNTCVTTKTVPVRRKNQITIFHELTGSGKRLYEDQESRFTVRLFHGKTGEELRGMYHYQGSRDGYIRSGDTVCLAGNESITIDPDIYQDIRYEVMREPDGRILDAWGESGTAVLDEEMKLKVSGIASSESGGYASFTRTVANTTERERFQAGESYILEETTRYTDGTVWESGRFMIKLRSQASIEGIHVPDRKTKAALSKMEITGEQELPGCEMELRDDEGNLIEEWISGDQSHELEGVLIPGETYILREVNPAPGYAYAEEVSFTVNEDGAVERVLMIDRPTRVGVTKVDDTSKKPVSGARLQILDNQGIVREEWVSGQDSHMITAKLSAGQQYYLHEEAAPQGYQKGEDLTFVVPRDGEPLELMLGNHRISQGDDPEFPEKHPKTVGWISVHYQTGLDAPDGQILISHIGRNLGWKKRILRLSQTGDNSHTAMYGLLAGLAVCGAIVIWVLGKRKKRKP